MTKTLAVKTTPRTVTAKNGETNFLVMNYGEALPSSFALKATQAKTSVAIRIGGGCSGMGEEDKEQMVQYFLYAFQGYQGVVFSGGTRQATKEDEIDLLVTELPGFIAEQNSDCVALGTLPRTAPMKFVGESQLKVDEWGAQVNVAMDMVLMIQEGPDGTLDWDGDLDAYFALMQQWRDYAGFTVLGGVFWNGGETTKKEIIRCAQSGFVTILVRGSGRITDECINLIESGDEDFLQTLGKDRKVIVVDRNSPSTLLRALTDHGFIHSHF